MGIITVVLVSGGFLANGADGKLPPIPLWVVLAAHSAIGLGTLTGGWRIVKTMGSKIAKLQPVGGFCAETAGALTLAANTILRNSGFDDPHDYGRNRRCRFGKKIFGGQMGRSGQNRLGLGFDDSGGGGYRRHRLRNCITLLVRLVER